MINLVSDIRTYNYIHATQAGLYAKIFRIKNTLEIRPSNVNFATCYFNLYFNAQSKHTYKSYSVNVYVSGGYYKNIMHDLLQDNHDFELVSINDGTYTTFYVSAPNDTGYNNYFCEVQFTKMEIPGYIEKLAHEGFTNDIAAILIANPTYDLYRAALPMLYISHSDSFGKDSFICSGATVGYTKIFSIDMSACTYASYFTMLFSASSLGGSLTANRDTNNIYSIRIGCDASGVVNLAKGSVLSGYNSDMEFLELPVNLVVNDGVVDIYVDHNASTYLTTLVHLISYYASNSAVTMTCIESNSIDAALPSYDSLTIISSNVNCDSLITYSNNWVAHSGIANIVRKVGNRIDVTMAVEAGTVLGGSTICTLPYTNANGNILITAIVNNGGTYSNGYVVLYSTGNAIKILSTLAGNTAVYFQFSYYIN